MSDNLIIPEHLRRAKQAEMEQQMAPEIMRAQQEAMAQQIAHQRHLRLQALAHEYFKQQKIEPHDCILVERHFYDKGQFRIEWAFEPKQNAKPDAQFEQTLEVAPPPEEKATEA